jgi:hypothetical protein
MLISAPAFWFYLNALPGNPSAFISVDDNTPGVNLGWRIGIDSSGKFGFIVDPDTIILEITNISSLVAVDEWHHIALTFNDATSTVKIYLDGVLENSATLTTSPHNASLFHVGAQDTALSVPGFDGKMDDLLIYDKAIVTVNLSLHD